jgi:hypothetical protein
MSKKGSIQIHDVKRRVKRDGVRVTVEGYVIKSVGKNGEILQCSETFNDVKAVKTHFAAMCKLWNTGEENPIAADYTAAQKFTKSGIALPAI